MRILTLNDGTIYEVDWCHADKGIFNINLITKESFIALASKFSDPECTSRITVAFGEDHVTVHEGYTELKFINIDSWTTGTTLICLMQPDLVA